MNKAQLYMDFASAKTKADQLDELAQQLEKAVNSEYKNGVNSARCAWKGDASDSFKKNADKLEQKTKQAATNLKTCAKTIRQVAQTIYNAEMRAIEIAEKRTYN